MTDNALELDVLNAQVQDMADHLGLTRFREETRSYREMIATQNQS